MRPLGGGRWLVESSTTRGVGHRVTSSTCNCKGFQFRGQCRHVTLIQAIEPHMRMWMSQAIAQRPASLAPLREAFGC